MKPTIFVGVASALLLAACGGGGTASSPTAVAAPGTGGAVTPSLQQVSGTLTIGNPGTTATSTSRSPAFVSASTKHVSLFIDGGVATAGQTGTCSATTAGTGTTGCTITWAAQLTVPASHTFAVEADSNTNDPANTVLAMGAGSYAIVAGASNTLTALSLNGVAGTATFTVGTCTVSSCPGNITIADKAGNAIAYTGGNAVPTLGNTPSSGNVFDNGAATFVSTAPTIGVVSGIVQGPFSSLAGGILTVSGVDTTGIYTYQVTCLTSGTFGITIAGAATPDTVVTSTELGTLVPAVTYPGALALAGTAPLFTCVGTAITSTGGTLPVN